MISIGEAPSNQMQLDLGDKGAQLMQEARQWTIDNPDAWERYLSLAHAATETGYASPNFVLQTVRHACRVSVPNAYAPALARLAMEQDSRIKFRLRKSMADGFAGVEL